MGMVEDTMMDLSDPNYMEDMLEASEDTPRDFMVLRVTEDMD